MADNYETVVGVIKVKMVTPVIRALFGCYNLDDKYPGGGEAYISSDGASYEIAYWEGMMPALSRLCEYLKIALPTTLAARLTSGYNVDEDEVEFPDDLAKVFEILFIHFGTIDLPSAQHCVQILKNEDLYETPRLGVLFEIAKLLDDGHGLERYQVDAAWTCSKPRLGEFGGWGEYRSDVYQHYASSHVAAVYGQEIDPMLRKGDYADAGNYLADRFKTTLGGVIDPDMRQQVAQAAINHLSNTYNPIPQGQPASNEAQMNRYEMPVFILTPQEQREAIAESAYKISVNWAERTDIDPYEKCFGVAGDMLRMFQNGYGATVPPMQITPVNWGGPFTYDVQRENLSGKNEFEAAQWVYDKPIALSSVTDSVSEQFDEIVESYHRRSANAAKKMFGT